MNRLLKENLSELKVLCKKFNVKELFVFGSITNGHFTSESDIDFLVSFEDIPPEKYADQYFDLQYELENLFQRKIDLVTVNSLSNPYFIKSINENKELVYAA
jgi:uncharacterized protein